MKIDIINIQLNDEIVALHNIGCLSNAELDKHVEKLLPYLDSIFGRGRCTVIPVREGPTWDFSIVRKPPTQKIKKVA